MIHESSTTVPGILAGLEAAAADEILGASEKRNVKAKSLLMIAGEPASHLFMLSSGRVRCYKTTKTGDEIILYMLQSGDVFGLATMLSQPPPFMANAESVSDCELLIWRHEDIRALVTTHPQLAENALRIALQYLKAYSERHAGLVSKTAEQRLAMTLLGLSHRGGRVHPNGVEVDATNEQLSSLADISRFTASRVLNSGRAREWSPKHAQKS
jgi:CRP-like cAMP-binding protein